MLIEKSAFLEFAKSWKYERVILVANNPNTSPQTLLGLNITKNDVVVQFNKCIFFDALDEVSCHKVFLFNLSKDNNHFGFDGGGKPERNYASGNFERLSYLFPYRIADRVQPAAEALAHTADVAVFDPGAARVPLPLPPGKAPSAGYKMLCLFHHLNTLRQKEGHAPAPILAVGFNPAQVTGHPSIHEIHDFSYEQETAFSWPEVRRVL